MFLHRYMVFCMIHVINYKCSAITKSLRDTNIDHQNYFKRYIIYYELLKTSSKTKKTNNGIT